ncbi:hypothetical protein [Cellulomonas sp. URHE0023]|uniref:hypothetical protein n=1 Tax=Cellulomonas sp. URHE0023 TaxID=1380354 RepID=UPI000487253D|nr:hypothetical protein [Cellulomonas sp. URHE0023]
MGGTPERSDTVGSWLRRHWFALVAWSGLVVVFGLEVAYRGWDVSEWGWFWLSGIVAFLVAAQISRHQGERVDRTVRRLVARGVLTGSDADDAVTLVRAALAARARWVLPPFVLGFAMLMLVFWVNTYGGPWVLETLGVWIEVALAGVAGGVVGMLVTYGMLSSVIGQVQLRLEPIPEHVDGASGLAPVGQLFGRQAAVVGVLVVYSVVWWFLLPQSDYSSWAVAYAWIILIAVVCEVAAFVAPLWGFHLSMTAYRAHLLDEADALGTRIARLRQTPSGDDEIDRLVQRWTDIETMPTWPVPPSLRRRFTWVNGLALVPVALDALGVPDAWGSLFAATH